MPTNSRKDIKRMINFGFGYDFTTENQNTTRSLKLSLSSLISISYSIFFLCLVQKTKHKFGLMFKKCFKYKTKFDVYFKPNMGIENSTLSLHEFLPEY